MIRAVVFSNIKEKELSGKFFEELKKVGIRDIRFANPLNAEKMQYTNVDVLLSTVESVSEMNCKHIDAAAQAWSKDHLRVSVRKSHISWQKLRTWIDEHFGEIEEEEAAGLELAEEYAHENDQLKAKIKSLEIDLEAANKRASSLASELDRVSRAHNRMGETAQGLQRDFNTERNLREEAQRALESAQGKVLALEEEARKMNDKIDERVSEATRQAHAETDRIRALNTKLQSKIDTMEEERRDLENRLARARPIPKDKPSVTKVSGPPMAGNGARVLPPTDDVTAHLEALVEAGVMSFREALERGAKR